MTIDEAIEQVEERACGNDQCAKDHAQLADWLRELRRARMEIDLLKTLRDGFKADAQKYKDENDKLRELAKAVWILFLKHGAVSPYELLEVDRVRESLNELGIKVSWEELGIEVEQ